VKSLGTLSFDSDGQLVFFEPIYTPDMVSVSDEFIDSTVVLYAPVDWDKKSFEVML